MTESSMSPIPLPVLSPDSAGPVPPWIIGTIRTPVGNVSRVSTRWDAQDRRGELKARVSDRFRMRYEIRPGLLAVGNPSAESPVLLSANYKLSFDRLRRELEGLDAWILVLDTAGINVWCAAGKGTFGTDEIIRRIRFSGLDGMVSHRRIIAPQLGAPGIRAHEVKAATGFRIKFGPVEARDIPAYLENGEKTTSDMRRITFNTTARAVLVPMEFFMALKKSWKIVLALMLFFGAAPEGILFRPILQDGLPVLGLYLAVILAGTVVTPVLLPWIPFRSFTVKGFLVGLLPVAGAHFLSGFLPTPFDNRLLLGACYLVFPALSGYLALNFTGCTTFTSPSGVTKELRMLVKVYAVLAVAALILLISYKLQIWGII